MQGCGQRNASSPNASPFWEEMLGDQEHWRISMEECIEECWLPLAAEEEREEED